MSNEFIESEWRDLSSRLMASAQHLAGDDQGLAEKFQLEARKFIDRPTPAGYPLLLETVHHAATLAITWQEQRLQGKPAQRPTPVIDYVNTSDAIVDEASAESFPASDPPAWTSAVV